MANQFNPNQNKQNPNTQNVSSNPNTQKPYNKPTTTDKKGKTGAGKGDKDKNCGSC